MNASLDTEHCMMSASLGLLLLICMMQHSEMQIQREGFVFSACSRVAAVMSSQVMSCTCV